jgi:hypothetical protein
MFQQSQTKLQLSSDPGGPNEKITLTFTHKGTLPQNLDPKFATITHTNS